MSPGELLAALVIAVGLVGVVVQVLPGSVLVLAAIGVWAAFTGGAVAWAAFGVGVLAIAVAAVGKYVLAGRGLTRAGVPGSTLVWGGVAGVVGFFVVPVVGLPLGFVGGVYATQRVRDRDHAAAWAATLAAVRATGITIVVELAGALLATAAWVVAVVLT
ncbi:DUF456 domain-containing protein [Cellulomonas cellasea]|uniref:DUF456 domain-containing protein n=1 Tax=Cellulomonas cellasea TaxID=43670 RepID=UPI0025A44055|nr:DUF456 domain-containing protein [Cellulomonas cellasea]MDM8085621.1 DUF456 domain-containing protein [Cellulomonas cellasea]